MKTLLSLTLLILMSSTLVSCSGGKSATKLEISRGFLVNSSGFGGGLIISGKNTDTNQTFTKSLTTGLSTTLYIDAGNWIITAIGWDGEPHTPTATPGETKVFAGKPYCGKVITNLSASNPTINLTVTQATCGTSDFAGSFPDSTGATATLPLLKHVITCNTFFENPGPSDTLNAKHVNATTSLSYCGSVASDLKSKAESMRIHSLDKSPDSTTSNIGFATGCIEGGSTERNVLEPMKVGGPTNPYDSTNWELRLPLKGVPIFVTLFREPNCTDPVGEYTFSNGLETKDPDFDSALFSDNGDPDAVRLYLPGNDLRRARSSFAHLLPFFKDSSNQRFVNIPPSMTDGDYHAYTGQEKVVTFERESCDSFGSHINVSGTPVCIDKGRDVDIKFTPASDGAGTVVFTSGNNLNFYSTPVAFKPVHETQKLMWKLTGPESEFQPFKNFFNDGKESELNDDDYGVLSRVRSMLMGNGAGGILGIPDSHFSNSLTFTQSCMAASGDNTVNVFNFETASYESYRVKVTTLSSPTVTNNFMCDDNDYDSDCTISPRTLKKRMLVWDYKSELVLPVIAMEFDCTVLVGSFESRFPKDEYGLKFEHRSKLNWNTNLNSHQRVELIEWSHGKTSANIPRMDQRAIYRLQKDGTGDYYAAWSARFRSIYDGTSQYLEDFTMQELRYGGSDLVAYSFIEAANSSSTFENLFTDSSGAVPSVRASTPVGYTASTDLQNEYNRAMSYPQSPAGSTSTDGYDLSGSVNNSELVFGMDISPSSLDGTFKAKFGTSFFTNP